MRAHEIQIMIRHNLERVQHLIEHATMLSGHTDANRKLAPRPQLPDQRTQFDGFRTRPKHKQDACDGLNHTIYSNCFVEQDFSCGSGFYLVTSQRPAAAV